MPSERVIWGPPGTGKCVDPETYVFTQDGMLKIGTIVEQYPGEDRTVPLENVWIDGQDGARAAALFYDGGRKECLRIRTRRGLELVGTLVHPVLSMRDGDLAWVKLSDLRPGDRVAVRAGRGTFPDRYPDLPACPPGPAIPGGGIKPKEVRIPKVMTEDLATWLGWFIGEGCWHRWEDYSVGFFNFSEQVVQEFFWLTAGLFGLTMTEHFQHNFTLGSTKLKRWLKEIGAEGLAAEKKVPEVILRSPASCQGAFLKAIFEAEGSVNISKGQIEFSTASEEMGKQIQLMLLNFGIVSRRSWKEAETKRWGRRRYWRIHIEGPQVITFRDEIGFMKGSLKHGKLRGIEEGQGWNLAGLPTEFVSKRYEALREGMKKSKRRFPREFWRRVKGVARTLGGRRADVSQKLVARRMVAKGLEVFSDFSELPSYREIREEYESKRYWDEVEEVEDVGGKQVVDLTVPDGHSFVGNGIICHNTTAGITLARHWTEQGASSANIAYLAFTKAAAKAAAVKIFESEDDTKMAEQFPYFRTIHSLCYLGLRKNRPDARMISTGDMKQFAKTASMDGMYAVYDWEDLAEMYAKMEDRGRTEWDRALTAYTFSRVKARTIEELDRARFEPVNEGRMMLEYSDLDVDVYRTFVEKYERFKVADGLIDFTDMLEYGVREMPPFDDIQYVVIDEAQDLAPLHHAIIDRLLGKAGEIWWIGDDDQAIFKFSGASAELFLERSRRATVQHQLRQTHRFGQDIVDFSNQIIRRVTERHPKEIVGVSGRKGKIEVAGEFEPIAGDVMILHRHVQGCQNVAQQYIEAGIPFRNERGRDPLDSVSRIKAWQTIQALAKGEAVSRSAVAQLVEDMLPSTVLGERQREKIRLVVHGAKAKLEEKIKGPVTLQELVMAKVLTTEGASVIQEKEYSTMRHSEDLGYYDRVVKNGYDLDMTGNIPRITTIHGAKGRQAERAVIFSEMGGKCWDDADTEHRLAYVAATRTQTDVLICHESKVHWAKDVYNYPVDEEVVRQDGHQ